MPAFRVVVVPYGVCNQLRLQASFDVMEGSQLMDLRADLFTDAEKERFWSLVEQRGEDECWLWRGSVDRSGYGHFSTPRTKTVAAHRVALVLTQDVVLTRKDYVCHVVVCPHKDCCNPKHIYVGDAKTNAVDYSTVYNDATLSKRRETARERERMNAQRLTLKRFFGRPSVMEVFARNAREGRDTFDR